MLDKNGSSVEAMYNNGGVAKLPLADMTTCGLTPQGTADRHGHFNLTAQSNEIFDTYSEKWAASAAIISYEDTISVE